LNFIPGREKMNLLSFIPRTDKELEKKWREGDAVKITYTWLASSAGVAIFSFVLGLAMIMFTPTKPEVAFALANGLAMIGGGAMLIGTIPAMFMQFGFPNSAVR
jgi:hypothetical protein